MATRQLSREEYYFDGKCFKAKSTLVSKIRLFVAFMIILLAVIPLTTSYTQEVRGNTNAIANTSEPQQSGLYHYVNTKVDDEKEAAQISEAIKTWSTRFKVDEKLIAAIIEVESGFSKFAISPGGAMGLMQIMPRWHINKIISAKDEVGTPEVFDVDTNIYIGSWVMSECYKQNKNAMQPALRCYNGSGDPGYASKVLTHFKKIKSFIQQVEA